MNKISVKFKKKSPAERFAFCRQNVFCLQTKFINLLTFYRIVGVQLQFN